MTSDRSSAVFLGVGLIAAGCKCGSLRLGWISFLVPGGAAAFLVWRHGVWPLAAGRSRDWLPCSPGGRSSRVPAGPQPGPSRTSGCGCGCTRAAAGHLFELRRHWSRSPSARRARYARGVMTGRAPGRPNSTVFLGRAHYRHGAAGAARGARARDRRRRGPAKPAGWRGSHALPRPGADRPHQPDVYGLTSGTGRAMAGRWRCSTRQQVGGVPSTLRLSPSTGARTGRSPSAARTASPTRCQPRAKDSDCSRTLPGLTCGHCSTRRPWPRGDMRLVSLWALTASRGGAQPAEEILREHGAPDWAAELSQLRSAADKTAATNEIVMSQMLSFMIDPGARRGCTAGPGRPAGPGRASCAKTGNAVHDRRQRRQGEGAARAPVRGDDQRDSLRGHADRPGIPGGRLDPPLLMAWTR